MGTLPEMLKEKDKDTRLYDLRGKTLMPAFIDAHSHISALVQTLPLVALGDAKSFGDIIRIMRQALEQKAGRNNGWLMGFGYDHNLLAEKRHPDKSVLDQISREIPILITHASGHMGVMNSAALLAAGITQDTEDHEGGRIGRREGSREPNGYLEENAFIQTSSRMPGMSAEEMDALIGQGQETYLSCGITTAQDGLVRSDAFSLLQHAAERGQWKLDVVGYVDLQQSRALWDDNPAYQGKYQGRFKLGGYKIILDGSPQGRTAWLTQPYEREQAGYCGYPIYTDGEVTAFFTKALEEGVQILAHCNGDAACEQMIRCYDAALEKHRALPGIRPVMIHAQTVRDDQLKRMERLHIIPSFFVSHIFCWGDAHLRNLGARAYAISPADTAVSLGMPYTFHQDTPVLPPDMLSAVWCAVNRITRDGVVLGEERRITPLQALRAVTKYPAYQYFEEGEKGSLRPGKLADLVILDKNPLKVPPIKINEIQVLATIKEGGIVYRKE